MIGLTRIAYGISLGILSSMVLTACGGIGSTGGSPSQPSAMTPGSVNDGGGAVPTIAKAHSSIRSRPERTGSWMSFSAKKDALLYISDYGNSTVTVFSYPSGTKVGNVAGLDRPQGECVDKAGNIWITDSAEFELVEYAHGGTTPIATLSDPGYFPVGCSVNQKTGDLAVANIEQSAHGLPGTIAVFKNAQGSPTYYDTQDQGFYTIYSVGYDGKGNLFFDGTNAEAGANGKFLYGEVPKGTSNVVPLTLTGPAIGFPGTVQWDGHYIDVGDQDNAVIYQTSGSQIVSSTPLNDSSDVVQFFPKAKKVVTADAGNGSSEFYKYPLGGTPVKTIDGFTTPIGAVISK